MSDLTPCNHDTLQRMMEKAEKRGVGILVKYDDPEADGWTSVRYADQEKPIAYFLELPSHCVC